MPDLFQNVEKSVVQITDSNQIDLFESRLGSGFIYDDNGHIITDHHVVAEEVIGWCDVSRWQCISDFTDRFRPVCRFSGAVVKDIKGKTLSLSLNSSKVRVGERVAPIGDPFGLSGSMSTGIVSGVGRQIPAQEGEGFTIPDIIQTDAPINIPATQAVLYSI